MKKSYSHIKIIQPKTVIPEGMYVYQRNLEDNLAESNLAMQRVEPQEVSQRHLDSLINSTTLTGAGIIGETASIIAMQNAINSGNSKAALGYCALATGAGIYNIYQASKLAENPIVHSFISKVKGVLKIPSSPVYDNTLLNLNNRIKQDK